MSRTISAATRSIALGPEAGVEGRGDAQQAASEAAATAKNNLRTSTSTD